MILGPLFLSAAAGAKAATVTLVYEVEKAGGPADQWFNINRVLLEVKNRLALADIRDATVNASGDSKLSIVLPDPMVVDRAKEAVNRHGIVEFRIVADTSDEKHSKLIEIARAQPGDQRTNEVRDADKNLVGKWVKVRSGLKLQSSAMQRKDKDGNAEVLVAMDSFNVTGEYISSASPAVAETGAVVEFKLNDKGAKLFGELTGSNLPDPVSGTGRDLATIVDDQLFSSATIRSRISDSGRISGEFSESDVLRLVNVLKPGPLSARLKLVSDSSKENP
jgi:preprotein translocase subunit SecD